MYTRLSEIYGKDARDRTAAATQPGLEGALAALESFYFAFDNGDTAVFYQVWIPDPLVRLKNPLGGVLEGIDAIAALYGAIFDGPADVWVEFWDIVAYDLGETATVFSGRERGEFARDGVSVELDIRTSCVFHFSGGRWGQVHHHGSITNTDQLIPYRTAVTG